MGRAAKELGDKALPNRKPGLHAAGGVSGLYLQVLPSRLVDGKVVQGSRSWILRVMIGGKRRDMGLGGYPSVTLAGAREKAREARAMIDKGLDPILQRREAKLLLKRQAAKALATASNLLTFRKAAAEFIKTNEAGWRNAKHRWQWENTLSEMAYPHMGDLAVYDVDVSHVLDALKPAWTTRTETASRLRGRIEAVLSFAKAQDRANSPMFPPHWQNPARWRGHLDQILTRPAKLKPSGHLAAMAVDDVSEFMTRLRNVGGQGARALEFAILTAARSGEVRGATWSEINLVDKVWTVPAERMKAGKLHRVPLSPAAMTILEDLPRMAGTDLVFASARGGQISERTLLAALRRMDAPVTVHGFRSTFRDWCGEHTNFPREVAEAALAHVTGNAVEQAYRRGDALLKRRKLMEAWAAFVGAPGRTAEIVPISRGRK
jgi:integrase